MIRYAWTPTVLSALLLALCACGNGTAPPAPTQPDQPQQPLGPQQPEHQLGITACQSAPTVGAPVTLQDVTHVALNGAPFGVAVSSSGLAYVSLGDSAVLASVATPGYAFSSSVAVGSARGQVAFNSTGTKAYVANQLAQTVGFIDVASNTQVSTVPVTGNPLAVVVGSGDTTVYVTTSADSVFGIQTTTGLVTHRLALPILSSGLAVCDSLLYVSTRVGGTVTIVDTKRDSVLRVLYVGGAPQGLVVAPDGRHLYVANQSGSLLFWDLSTNTSEATVLLTGSGFGLTRNPADGRLYVTNLNNGRLEIFDPDSHARVGMLRVGGRPRQIAFNPAGTIAVVANEDGWVDFLTAPGVVPGPFTHVLLDGGPYGVAISAQDVLYVTLLGAHAVATTTLPALAFPSTVQVEVTPTTVAFNSTGSRAYVTNQTSQSVSVVDVAAGQQVTKVVVNGDPFGVIVAPGDSIVWVTTTNDSLFGIQVASATVTRRLHVPASTSNGTISSGMAIRDSLLYVSTRDIGIVTEVNTRTDSIQRTFAVGGAPEGILLSATGDELYIANEFSMLQFWDVPGNHSIASVPLTGNGFDIARDPANGRLYVTTLQGGQVQIIDPITRTKVDSLMFGGSVRNIGFSTDGTIAAVSNEGGWVDFIH